MRLIKFTTAEIIAEMLCYITTIEYVTAPQFDYRNGVVSFTINADKGVHTFELDMTTILKLHDYKITQFAYSLVSEYYGR